MKKVGGGPRQPGTPSKGATAAALHYAHPDLPIKVIALRCGISRAVAYAAIAAARTARCLDGNPEDELTC